MKKWLRVIQKVCSLETSNFLLPSSLVCPCSFYIYPNLVPFHLWWKKIVLKSGKVSKCFVQDCSICCYSLVNSLVFIICSKTDVSLWCDSLLWEERLCILDFFQVSTSYILFNSSNCMILHVDACCFVTVNTDNFSCTNVNLYHHQCH